MRITHRHSISDTEYKEWEFEGTLEEALQLGEDIRQGKELFEGIKDMIADG